jgi:hypothetical protein
MYISGIEWMWGRKINDIVQHTVKTLLETYVEASVNLINFSNLDLLPDSTTSWVCGRVTSLSYGTEELVETYTAELLIPDPIRTEIETALKNFEGHKSIGIDEISA